jgi:DNA replication protein DnaC
VLHGPTWTTPRRNELVGDAHPTWLSHAEFLELILQDELLVRQERQIARRVKAALFRELKPLDEFNWSFNPSIQRKQIFDLATCRFIREARDVLFLGPPGVGKSFLVQAIGYQAIKQGHVVRYRSIFDVVRDFLHEEALGDEKVLSKYLKPDLLIVDDMGMKQLPKRSGEYLFEIIMRRYETRSTVMTSNRPLEDWGKLVGDEAVQPGIPSAHAPAGLVRDDHRRTADVLPQLGGGRLGQSRRAQIRAGTGGPRDRDAEQRAQHSGTLAVGKSQVFVQDHQRRMGFGTQLAGRRADRLGGLEFVAALHAAAAIRALPHVNLELAIDRRAGNLGLVLECDLGFDEMPAAAVRADLRQGRVVAFVDSRRNPAVRVPTVPRTRLPSGFLRVSFWTIRLAKGGRLPFGAALCRFESGLKLGDSRVQVVDGCGHRFNSAVGVRQLRLKRGTLAPQASILSYKFLVSGSHDAAQHAAHRPSVARPVLRYAVDNYDSSPEKVSGLWPATTTS